MSFGFLKGKNMKKIGFFHDTARVETKHIDQLIKLLSQEKERMREIVSKKYDSIYASLYAPMDKKMREIIKGEVERIKKLQPSLMIVIGIGGSNLGTKAIDQALRAEPGEKGLEVYYADSVDPEASACLKKKVEQALKNKEKVILVVATKSGRTTETIANFELFLGVLTQFHPNDFQKYVAVITDEDTPLYAIAKKHSYALLAVPQKVGGRFSTFSAVGLLPLCLMGIDIEGLCEGASSIIHREILNNEAHDIMQSAAINFWHYKQGKSMRNIFLFSVLLEGIGNCYRQYIGESLGKQFDLQKKEVRVGITPLVSIGTIDLHSVGQLYYGGPRDKNTTFITVKKVREDINVPNFAEFDVCVKNIQGVSFSEIMKAVISGVKESYKNEELPFTSIELPEISSFYLGQLLQFAMIETMFIGYLLNINPFDQPHVELYKQETRKILAHE
jgi:glucose-6-phosphate isomerase